MADWIVIADDDISSLRTAENILSKAGKRVTALKSGKMLLDHIRKNGYPDLILMGSNIPESGGFEIMNRLKIDTASGEKVPVILLIREGRQELEAKGFEAGAADCIRKPLNANTLISRTQKILDEQKELRRSEREKKTDPLTGLLDKTAAEARISMLCQEGKGMLCLFDLDSFRAINSVFGRDIGDRILVLFARILHKNVFGKGELGRFGGDEFVAFIRDMAAEEELIEFTEKMNADLLMETKRIMDSRQLFRMGVSVGAVAVPEYGRDYKKLFQMADNALGITKQNGRHGCTLYTNTDPGVRNGDNYVDLETITSILEERNESPSAMWMGNEVFSSIYRYMVRYMGRYHSTACRVLFSIKPAGHVSDAENAEIMTQFRRMMQTSLRSSDVMMECGENQVFLLLPEIQEYDIDHVLSRLIKKWKDSPNSDKAEITYEAGKVQMNKDGEKDGSDSLTDTVVIVDDDETVLRKADEMLSKHGINVTAAGSGSALLEQVKIRRPGLILLDTSLPDLSGVDVLHQLRDAIDPERTIPVIILTEDGAPDIAERCLRLGAMDFIRKPFISEVLYLRVRHALELGKLRRNMADAVQRKAQESERISMHIVLMLAETIDAKDKYTNGHSTRVAEYAREIGRRSGYTTKQQNDIYMMGLLHDIGKIGVPDAVINKPGKLTAPEYDMVRMHPVLGGRILHNIEELPNLYAGARWHHERYDGNGYPDGLAGRQIPEEARIIAVADAYDAMTSRRSYRSSMSQDQVRAEIQKCSGSQFDPKFAEIMLNMIDEDKNFDMREK